MSTPLRIIDSATVRRLAPPEQLIDWMRDAMISTSRRAVELPLRRGMVLPGGLGVIGMMPGYVGDETASAGVKLVSLVPPARRRGSSHLGLMVLYDADGLVPQAVLCGATITALRTVCASRHVCPWCRVALCPARCRSSFCRRVAPSIVVCTSMNSSLESRRRTGVLLLTWPIVTWLGLTPAAAATAAMKAILTGSWGLLKLVADVLRVTTAVIFLV